MLVIVGHLREPEFAFAIAATDFVAIFFRVVIIVNVFRAHPEVIVLHFRLWEHPQKLALAGLDWIVFCPLLDNMNRLFHVFACISVTVDIVIFFAVFVQWAFKTIGLAFAQSV
jgi:hypothetical protein